MITGKRPDGYHSLISLMCATRLSDTVTIEPDPGRHEITVTCQNPAVPEDQGNIAYMAAKAFFKALDMAAGVKISIEKKIPVAAGLGGGSSNAAAVLRGLNRYYGLPLTDDKLRMIASTIGADVPFFISPKPSIARGIGDRLTTYRGMTASPLVLVNPMLQVSTGWAYNNLNLGLTKCKKTITCSVLKHKEFKAEKHLCNDLEPVTASRYPVITAAKKALMENGATGALMSGSGPTVFGVFSKTDIARKAFDTIRASRKWQVFLTEIWTDP